MDNISLIAMLCESEVEAEEGSKKDNLIGKLKYTL